MLPVAIGLAVVVLMFWHDAKEENLADIWKSISITPRTVIFILLGFLCMFGRDFGLTWRFRALTSHELPWKKAWKVDMLCEFTSCVTPSAVGGSSLGMVFLWSQGINFGRATTLMMTTLFLDELFFVLACPLVALFTPDADLFASGGTSFSHGIRLTFWIVYGVLFLWTLLLFLGIIVKPLWIRSALAKICSLRFLNDGSRGQFRSATIWWPRLKNLNQGLLDFGSKYSEARLCLGLHAILWSTRSSWLSFLSAILTNGSSSPGNS